MSRNASQLDTWQLQGDDVHVWHVDIDIHSNSTARLYDTLSSAERLRCDRFRFEIDRKRFVVAHAGLRDLLGRYLEIPPEQVAFSRNEFGKPELSPALGSALRFNLSHSAELALIAVTADAAVGIDVERIDMTTDFADAAGLFFSSEEIDYLMTRPQHVRCEAFFGCWTKKEAYLKASGEGLSSALASFTVPLTTEADGRPVEFLDRSRNDEPRKSWSIYTLAPAPGYLAALAVEGVNRRLTQRSWRLPSRPAATAGRLNA